MTRLEHGNLASPQAHSMYRSNEARPPIQNAPFPFLWLQASATRTHVLHLGVKHSSVALHYAAQVNAEMHQTV